jgi:hypothetical protein
VLDQIQHEIRDQTRALTPLEDIDMAIDMLMEGIKHLQVFKHLQDLRAVFTALIGFVLL